MIRDFTYVDDVIESLFRVINKPPRKDNLFDTNNPNCASSWAPYKIFNIGNSRPTNLKNYIKAIEKYLNKKADIILEDIQPGDVEKTFADTENLEKWINFKPGTSIDEGIKNFISWYLNYYKKNIK